MRTFFKETLKRKNIIFQENVKTADLCTFRIGGTCRYLIEPQCIGELVEAILLCEQEGISYVVIGRGSNLLFSDASMSVALIRTTALDGLLIQNNELIASCGMSLPHLAQRVARLGFSDLVFACGIPGTLGGGICMNAGAHGKDLGSLVKWVEVLYPKTGEIRTLFNKELSYSYRNSLFQHENILALRACLTLCDPLDFDAVRAQMCALIAHRKATQPIHLPSAGSVFKRANGNISIGKILDELGLKGMRCGNAAISEKHAGFIVNLGGAKAADVSALIDRIKCIVKREKGFEPRTEIRFVGFDKY